MTDYVFVPTEELGEYDDDGTIVNSVQELAGNIVGHRIVKVEQVVVSTTYYAKTVLQITLDTGKVVQVADDSDCCAYTELQAFLFNADKVDHIITGVRTEDGYGVWSFFADAGDILSLTVGWSSGNPFYYGYGFDVTVLEVSE